jgi:hypothetical protein
MASTNKEKRIEELNKNIERLIHERDTIQNKMTQELVTLLMKKNVLAHDFETLKGGLLSVVDILNRTDTEAEEQKDKWKEYLKKKKK